MITFYILTSVFQFFWKHFSNPFFSKTIFLVLSVSAIRRWVFSYFSRTTFVFIKTLFSSCSKLLPNWMVISYISSWIDSSNLFFSKATFIIFFYCLFCENIDRHLNISHGTKTWNVFRNIIPKQFFWFQTLPSPKCLSLLEIASKLDSCPLLFVRKTSIDV